MASNKGYGLDQGSKRRLWQRKQRRKGDSPRLELLENRLLLTGGGGSSTTVPGPVWTPTDTNLFDAQNGPMANLGTALVSIYQSFVQSGGNTAQLDTQFPQVEFQNGLVGVLVKSLGGDFSQFETQLTDVGMHVIDASAYYGVVDGWAPVSALPTIAQMQQTESGMALFKPITSQLYQGVAYNEAETSLFADVARTQFGVDGTGVTIGVLSDSVSQFNGGLGASYATGDLNSKNPVNVIQDGPAGSTDEGRAMLENIHDIAPGANLQFATATPTDMNMATNIAALAKAGSQLIVDDVKYADEPFFQNGFISQAVSTVVGQGVTYFSAAGNEGPDSGYLSTFRAGLGTVPGVGTGTFMNFNPGAGTNLLLPITTGIANANIIFQFDQPFATQQPAGSTATVSSEVNFYVLSIAADGTATVVASGTNNNVATQEPLQMVTVPSAGNYFVAMQVVSGPNPGHVEFVGFNDTNGAVSVSTQYGSGGGTYYPATYGHDASPSTIGVGATPWWAPAPYLGQNPLASEPFSSSGPALIVLNPDGTPMSTPQVVQNPAITAPDGGNTSFFSPGFFLNTTAPPVPGQPATSTNLVPANQQTLPVFFGTSSAAPNATAVAALMLQKVPSLTPAQIRAGLIASTLPMNGTPAGTWDAEAGFGLINAISAINAVDLLRVVSTNPAAGSTVTITPSAITVTFNKPVNFSTVSAADLTFTAAPPGVTVSVGTPIAVDNPTDPTKISWPFSFTKPAGTLANGSYTFSIQSPSSGPPVTAQDGKELVPSGPIKFTLADITAPVINATNIAGRQISITFSKALDPGTVKLSDIFVLRQGTNPVWPPNSSDLGNYINLNTDPRTTISYNSQTFTVTLNYSGLPQTELPSDHYAIVVLSNPGVTDLVGNPLDGNFTGTFPSGSSGQPADFIQDLGLEALSAPTITTFTMNPAPTNDTGVPADQNTNISQPSFIGQVFAPFPGTVANVQVFVQFGGLHDGDILLGVGGGGRGYVGPYDVVVTTDANGGFSVTPPKALPEGFQEVVAVVVGQPDQPPLPGFASQKLDGFRIDKTPPQIASASFVPGGPPLPLPNGPAPNTTFVPTLTSLSLNVVDPVNPITAPFGTPTLVVLPALNPQTAINISNYSLINVTLGNQDESKFIATATWHPLDPVPDSTGNFIVEYTGRIDLTFNSGLPAGVYEFVAHTTELQYPGLTDAAGNPLDETNVPGEGTKDFVLNFDIQPTPVYITGMAFESKYTDNGSTVVGGPQSYYEVPPQGGPNMRDGVPAPPTVAVIDFSNPLPYGNYTNDVQLISSTNGNFGNLGEGGLGSTGTGFTPLSNYTVTLYNYNPLTQTSTVVQPGGSGNRLVLQLNKGVTLAPAYYRLYIPNQVEPGNIDTRIDDVYGNQLDGENLGNPTSSPSTDFPSLTSYEDLQSSGVYRQSDMSGDGVAGGAFTTGLVVVPYGNVVFARPDYVENPLLPSTLSDGSLAKPYPVLAPEGDPAIVPPNPSHDPNGGLNSIIYFQPGKFNTAYDRSGDGMFEQSALYAAQQLAYTGPVVVVALPGIPQRNPITGTISQASYVLQAPAGPNATVNNGSASVPALTTLVFAPGSVLKLQNASLLVQNQGSALQVQGTSTQQVFFTSYNDASAQVGGPSNNNPDTTPHPGDWGGIVFRNYDEQANPNPNFPVDGTLYGPTGAAAISGADDVMSIINFDNIRFGGGAVPQGSSIFYSDATLFNARPAINNSSISDSGGTGGTAAAIGEDFDSIREDDSRRGPLIRRVSVSENALNGIWLMSQNNGLVEPTNAIAYPPNPSTLGGTQNYTLDSPLPYIVLAQLVVGQEQLVATGGLTQPVSNRLYIQPGVMIKFSRGSALDVINPAASLNVGSRSYITGFDQDNNYSPAPPTNFVAESASDPQVLFTTISDDTATTTLVPVPINVTGEATTPTLGPAMWGSVGIQSGAIAVINAATFTFGGGSVNTTDFTVPSQSVLAFLTNFGFFVPTVNPDLGSHVYITNNNFFNNFDSAMQIEPNGLLAGDPLRPLLSGHPFFRGNVMQNNGIDGLSVITNRFYLQNAATGFQYVGPVERPALPGYVNQTVDAVWDATDLTYVLRGTVVLGGAYDFFNSGNGSIPTPNTKAYAAEPAPVVNLTIQAALPGTLLADGEKIPSPGQPVVVKLLSDFVPNGAHSLAQFGSTGSEASESGGAGFIVGVDDGVDPPVSPLVDPGAYSEIRILGIPGNQTTGQQRVPVILTSLRDDSVGVTARGVQENNIFHSWPTQAFLLTPGGAPMYPAPQTLTTPYPGDGGYIYIGGNSLTEYNPTDPRGGGSFIDNADISYMTRIEIQGGGINDVYNPAGGTNAVTAFQWLLEKTGYGLTQGFIGPTTDPLAPISQLNSAMTVTISSSNLLNFSDAAVFAHPDAVNALQRDWTSQVGSSNPVTPFPARSGFPGQGVDLYLFNDVIANQVPNFFPPPPAAAPVPIPFAQGVHVNSESTNDTSGESPNVIVLLNNTFYQTTYAVQIISPQFNGQNANSHSTLLAMNNIFDSSNIYGLDLEGQTGFSQLQYNVFWNNIYTLPTPTPPPPGNLNVTANPYDFEGNISPFFVDPLFQDATTNNFELMANSPAINAGRSEIGPNPSGDAVYPTVDQQLNDQAGIRTDPNTVVAPEQPGRSNPFGGDGFITDPRQILTLPGSGDFGFFDEFVPVLTSNPLGYGGPSVIPGTYNYEPISGQRDILGFIRQPQAGVTGGPGYGSNPFIDVGAYQYVNLHPPEVTGVTETPTQGATPVNFYSVGGISGLNQTPWTINVTFSGPIDPNSITPQDVTLVNLGSNPASPLNLPINLAGKLGYDSTTNTLIINLAASGLTLGTDKYQLTLFGSGSPVLANPQGVALDGENTTGGLSTGAQLALPSGNGYPGGNFFDSFIINTTPSSVLPGSLKMDPASDTNIVGDAITTSNLPTFDGTILEPNPTLVPLLGQTAIVDVGIAVVSGGTTTVYFDPKQLPSNLSNLAQYIRANAGTASTSATGTFQVAVGVDGANTGLVTTNAPLPNLFPVYDVGADGLLGPTLPADDSGYYVARVRVIDQSGNQSNPADPNAQLPFVVDNTAPTASFVAPTPNQVITSLNNGAVDFTITTSKNIDMTHFTPASISVVNAGPDGILGTADDVTVPINPNSITVTLLDKGTGGKGREEISFATEGTLTNNLYQVTLLNSGADAVRDIAGNTLAAPVSEQFVLAVPSLQRNLFVGGPAFVTDPTKPVGSFENPYPTISAAMTAAVPGDVVAVLPGVYTEQVTLKQFVRLLSANPSTSSDLTVFTTSTGDALSTIIRAPFVASSPPANYSTVTATNLQSFVGLNTEVAGFTIASPLLIDPAIGIINPTAFAINVTNSNILIDKDYIVDAGVGINVTTSGASALIPNVENDGLIGNIDGMVITDGGNTAATTPPANIINNDFAFNTIGLDLVNSFTTPDQASIASNIFWQNHDQTNQRNGFAILSTNPDKVNLRNNLFFGNGASDTDQSNATNNLGNGFDPAKLGTTAAAAQSNLGNFVGNPAFVFPIDPRPGSDGPATFFLDADFQLTTASAAIDNAFEATAIPTDFLGNSQVKIPGKGFGLPGYGPRDVGAFEFEGNGGTAIGGAFRVVTTSLVPNTGATFADGSTLNVPTAPTSVTVSFSGNVNSKDIAATDLVLSGSAVNGLNPVHAVSLAWIDAHTVQFNLAGQINNGGTLNVAIAPGSIQSTDGQSNQGYSDKVVININPNLPAPPTPIPPPPGPSPTPPPGTNPPTTPPSGSNPPATPPPAPSPTPVTPSPAPPPQGPHHHHKKKPIPHHNHKPPKHVGHHPKPKGVQVTSHKTHRS
jgi:hypothetical protein